MKKTNQFLAGLALMTSLIGQTKAQEMGPTENSEGSNTVAAVTFTTAQPANTNDVVVVEPTNTIHATTNVINTATATNNVEAVSNTTNTIAVTTNTVDTITTATNTAEQVATPVLSQEQQALLQEVVPQIKPFIMKDGMTNEQLFMLGAQMHLEENVGTRALSLQYWKAAEAGMDFTPFETAYQARLKEQQDFMKVCQEGIADARINHLDNFKISGVSFNINSTNLVENLLKFKDAKDGGLYSVIIDGRPFKIFRTPAEEKRLKAPVRIPETIITPYGTYRRETEKVR